MSGEIDTEKGRSVSKIKTIYYIETDSEKEQIDKFINLVEKYCTVELTVINTPEFEKEVIIL